MLTSANRLKTVKRDKQHVLILPTATDNTRSDLWAVSFSRVAPRWRGFLPQKTKQQNSSLNYTLPPCVQPETLPGFVGHVTQCHNQSHGRIVGRQRSIRPNTQLVLWLDENLKHIQCMVNNKTERKSKPLEIFLLLLLNKLFRKHESSYNHQRWVNKLYCELINYDFFPVTI